MLNPQGVLDMAADAETQLAAKQFMLGTCRHRYSYNFTWMGRPIIQYPQDIVAMQEIIWRVKPDLIIETGVAHGGSAVFYASMLELLGGDGIVVAIDVEIRPHNREAIESHPMFPRIRLIEGSSTASETLAEVQQLAAGRQCVLVCLDSNHTHDHVLRELQLYSPLVTPGRLSGRLRHHHRRPPARHVPRPPLGPGKQPQDGRARILGNNGLF